MRGGKRTGAGRKKGFAARNAEEARRVLAAMVMREIQPIGEALIKRAKQGDIAVCKELFDRAWGRAPQPIETLERPNTTALFENEMAMTVTTRYEEEIKKIMMEHPHNHRSR